MGGNALKNLNIERKSKKDYERICNEVKQKFIGFCSRMEVIPSYFNKQDYGDADILFISDNSDIKKCINDVFSPRQIFHNGNCFSFDYENFQIDLIKSNENDFDSSLNYYSYNDLGNLIGRIAHKFGLKYGHMGLMLPIRRPDSHLADTILISKDTKKILTFLGFDYSIYANGFIELDDIFNFVINSKYFNSTIFSYENLNHINRVRNKKRKTYETFLKWIEGKSFNNYMFNPDKTVYISLINEYFPEANILNNKKILDKKIEKSQIISSKFNGKLIIELIGLNGKSLGDFIKTFKDQFENIRKFHEWVLNTDQITINNAIKSTYGETKKS